MGWLFVERAFRRVKPHVRPAGFLVLFLAVPVIGMAGIISVPDDVASIQDAADFAVDGDEIQVAGGTYDESVEIVGKRLTLRAYPPGNRVQLLSIQIYDGADISLTGFDLDKTSGVYWFAALECVNAVALDIEDCSFVGITSYGVDLGYPGGEGINCALTPSVTIRNSTIQGGNGSVGGYTGSYDAGYPGGDGLRVSDCNSVVLEACSISGGNGASGAMVLYGYASSGGKGGDGLVAANNSTVTGTDVQLSGGSGGPGDPNGPPGVPYRLLSGASYNGVYPTPSPTPSPSPSPSQTPVLTPVATPVPLSVVLVPGDYSTIQDALDAVTDYCEIVVAPGTYSENLHFHGRDVILRSTDPTSFTVVQATIVDGGNGGAVVTFAGMEGPSCVLDGLTLQNGHSSEGGGIAGHCTVATIRRCVITWNMSITGDKRGGGGGIYQCNGVIDSNRIVRNTADYGGGIGACNGLIQNNVLWKNQAIAYDYFYEPCYVGAGGGINDCQGVIQNNTVFGNYSCYTGGGIASCMGATIRNCVVWGGNFTPCSQVYRAALTYSCIEDWTKGGEGNIADDPLFADPENGDFHLTSGSLCIDAGRYAPPIALDFEGDPRYLNGVAEPRGDGTDIDIGADEFRGTLPTQTPSPTPTVSPTPTASPIPTASPTFTPSLTPTPSPTVTPTRTIRPSPTQTLTPTQSLTPTPSVSPSPSLSPTATATPTASLTASPSMSPTATPLPTPAGGSADIAKGIIGTGDSVEILDQNGDGVLDVADIVTLLGR